MIKRVSLHIVFLFIVYSSGYSQNGICMDLIKSCYTQMSEDVSGLTPSKMIYIELETTTRFSESSGVNDQQELYKIHSTLGKSFMEGKQASVYQDENYIVTIIEPSKMIVILNNSGENVSQNPLQAMDLSQLDSMNVNSCIDMGKGENKLKVIELGIKDIKVDSRLIFYIDKSNNLIKRLVISGVSKEIKEIEYHYKTVQKNLPLNAEIKASALSKALTSSGKLKEQYKTYTLQDLRK